MQIGHRPVTEHKAQPLDMTGRAPVFKRALSRSVVGDHAAYRGTARGGQLGREKESEGQQLFVKLILDDACLYRYLTRFLMDLPHPLHIARGIHNKAVV